MVLFGAVMIFSASSVVAQFRMGSSYYFALRQLIWIALAVPLMMWIEADALPETATPGVAFTAMGLVVVLLVVVYFADPQTAPLDSLRAGSGGLQPSEFAKPALVLFLAFFIALRSRAINSRYTLLPGDSGGGRGDPCGGGRGSRHGDRAGDYGGGVFVVAGLERRYIVLARLMAWWAPAPRSRRSLTGSRE